MALQDILDLLRNSPLDTSFVLRLGEIPAPLLHHFACDCAERVFLRPRPFGGFPALPLRQLLDAKRAWIDGSLPTHQLQDHLDATELLISEPNDAILAVLRAALLDPTQAALQASQKAAWACFEQTFDQELEHTEQRFRAHDIIGPLFGESPVGTALRAIGLAVLAPRKTAARLLQSVRDEVVEVVDDFQRSFSSRHEEATWQRQHLIAMLAEYQQYRARLLHSLYQRALEKDQTFRRARFLLEASLFSE